MKVKLLTKAVTQTELGVFGEWLFLTNVWPN